ncbi:hypothetical protein E1176_06220 [Fulvivirga sp. RKSG066]|nr:hypothetical protein [Fulvivirga aurantia]
MIKKAAKGYFQNFREMTTWKEDDSWLTKTGKVLLDILGVLTLIAFSPFLLFALIVAFVVAL